MKALSITAALFMFCGTILVFCSTYFDLITIRPDGSINDRLTAFLFAGGLNMFALGALTALALICLQLKILLQAEYARKTRADLPTST
ncbi:hypothetical protein [Nitratireductor basaltis]|uniref:Uncharacterized protein n=1 Tax=Nitratireductor basaltis TaxID=472175 RepID=A0A084U917_9HYPH|nr:hypothetical protein [Nitratireductor basaltis]KFB09453.1 hypothetical protein EL18_00469 [Nitratireductor basaltis]